MACALVLAGWGGACQNASDDDASGTGGAAGTTAGVAAGAAAGKSGSAGAGAGAGKSGSAGAGAATNGGSASGSGGRGTGGGGRGASGTSGSGNAGGGATGGGGMGGTGTSGEAGQTSIDDPCENPALVWRTANKTNYTSYPDPGSEECIEFNGCMWEGQFAACNDKMPEAWVASHNIVAAFPDFGSLELHDLCLRKWTKTLVVTVLDTCGDSDCDGCCTENQGSAEQLIDIESYTNERWGVPDGAIEWADLGATTGDGCEG